ncbi:hypothetical protein [Streptomyces sp. B93]|uniref:hypothetical protein n=1 Tax=Streptomyces sp. B93 TaxID=2824875 RepID=UPI001B35A1DE|nr:hypothetical protein [Streptomyces sp. B93]MBQ1090580.1 hypothetical protein [Streptomyces sp. B93]
MPAVDTALAALPPGKEGTGSALSATLRQAGGAIGIALLGSLLTQVFTGRLDTRALPGDAADSARESVIAAQAVAARLDLPHLARSAEAAFTDGMTAVLLLCGITGLAAAVLAAFTLPDDRPAPAVHPRTPDVTQTLPTVADGRRQ